VGVKRRAVRLLAAAAVVYGPLIGMHALCITGAGGWAIPGAELFILVPLFCIVLSVLALPLLLPRQTRQGAVGALFYAVGLILLFMPAMGVAVSARRYGFELAAERARPLVNAVSRFEREKGRPPESLRALVPEYLPRLPEGIPEIELVARDNTPEAYGGNTWVLVAHVPTGIMNFDAFMYFPNRNYGEFPGVERIGDWAYVHE
jgi:hypothetical protein